jgi:hypothetical protein
LIFDLVGVMWNKTVLIGVRGAPRRESKFRVSKVRIEDSAPSVGMGDRDTFMTHHAFIILN